MLNVELEEFLGTITGMINMCMCAFACIKGSPHLCSCKVHCVSVCMRARARRETKKTDVRDNCLPVLVVTLPLFHCFHFFFTPTSFLCFRLAPSHSVLYLFRRDLVSPWPVGIERQP